MAASVQPLTHTVEETAKLLRLGRNRTYEAIAAGEIPSIRIGTRILVPRAALDLLLQNGAPGRGLGHANAEAA